MSESRSEGLDHFKAEERGTSPSKRATTPTQRGLVPMSISKPESESKQKEHKSEGKQEENKIRTNPISEVSESEMRDAIEKFINNNPKLTAPQIHTIILSLNEITKDNRFLKKEFYDYFAKKKIEVKNIRERGKSVSSGIVIRSDQFENRRAIEPPGVRNRFINIGSHRTLGPLLFHEWYHHLTGERGSGIIGGRQEADNFAIEVFFSEKQNLDRRYIVYLEGCADVAHATDWPDYNQTLCELEYLFKLLEMKKRKNVLNKSNLDSNNEELEIQKVISDYISKPRKIFIREHQSVYNSFANCWT